MRKAARMSPPKAHKAAFEGLYRFSTRIRGRGSEHKLHQRKFEYMALEEGWALRGLKRHCSNTKNPDQLKAPPAFMKF